MESNPKISSNITLTAPSELAVVGWRSTDAMAALDLLSAAGLPRADQVVGRVDQTTMLVSSDEVGGVEGLAQWLKDKPEAHVVLVMPQPTLWVAAGLADGSTLSQALDDWAQLAARVMAVVRRVSRARVSVCSSHGLVDAPRAWLDALEQRLGLSLVYRPVERTMEEARPSTLLQLVAKEALSTAPQTYELIAEWSGLAVPIGTDERFGFNRLEQVVLDHRKASIEPSEHETLRVKASDVEEQNELLVQQLHHVQEELERYFLKVQEPGPGLVQTQARLEAILASRSWKITRPLRVILGLLTGNKTEI